MSICLIDLSSVLYPVWHVMSPTDPNPDATSYHTVRAVRALTYDHPHAAICCDSGQTFRHAIDPAYKANRTTEDREPLLHQMALVQDTLRRDGFPVWSVDGFEADDLIASAVHQLVADPRDIVIVSSDKDLLCLVDAAGVSVLTPKGEVFDDAAVVKKFGVHPNQMLDYLCLVGDASDGVKGCPGVGPVHAQRLLEIFGNVDDMYRAFDSGATPTVTPKLRTRLQEFRPLLPHVRSLLTLRRDIALPIDEISKERIPVPDDTIPIVDDLADVFGEEPSGPGENHQPEGMDTAVTKPVALVAVDKMAIWNRNKYTDPRFVKKITGKPYQGNSPSPHYVVRRLTEEFGPCGHGWGFAITSERFERLTPDDLLHIARVSLWYRVTGETGETCKIEQVGQTRATYRTADGSKIVVDEDAPKKSVTDALVKCASYLGFAADIFSGRWDDNKYIQWLVNEKFKEGK